MIEDRIKQRALMHPSFSGSLWFFCSPFNSSHFTSLAPLLDAKSLTISSQMCSTWLGSMVFAWSEVQRQVPSAQIYFFLHTSSFRLDPESKMFTSLCRIADLFPLTFSLSDMSPSWIHLCCCGKEMKKNLSLNPCMHVPFDFIVCISDWWFCFLLTMYSGCHWCRVNKLLMLCEQTEPMLLFSFHFCSISIDGFWSK